MAACQRPGRALYSARNNVADVALRVAASDDSSAGPADEETPGRGGAERDDHNGGAADRKDFAVWHRRSRRHSGGSVHERDGPRSLRDSGSAFRQKRSVQARATLRVTSAVAGGRAYFVIVGSALRAPESYIGSKRYARSQTVSAATAILAASRVLAVEGATAGRAPSSGPGTAAAAVCQQGDRRCVAKATEVPKHPP